MLSCMKRYVREEQQRGEEILSKMIKMLRMEGT
jgi:hypothetical protein